MYDVVKRFYTTETPLSDIIKEFGDLNDPFEAALVSIIHHLDNLMVLDEKSHESIDAAVKKGHHDQDLFLLLISYLMILYSREFILKNESDFILAKHNSIYRISCSLDLNSYRTETQAYYYQSCSIFYYLKNNFNKGDELNFLSISKMPKDSPRYKDFKGKSAQIIGNVGRLSLIPNLEQEILDKRFDHLFYSKKALLMNALFTVNLELVEKYLEFMLTNFKERMHWQNRVGKTKCAIAVLNGNFDEVTIDYPEMNAGIAYYRALRNGEIEKAKKQFSHIRESYLYYACHYVFYFAQYHHSFVTGWFENIEEIIKNRNEKSYHYLLDFFIARYFLIKKKKDLARYYYAQLLANCEKFNAIGRLQFEMQFAFELTISSFFEFTYPRKIINSAELRKALDKSMVAPNADLFGLNRIIGNSQAINDIKKKVKLYAGIQRPILLLGETGAGKEIIARAIYEESSYKDKPFLAINCGALTDTLLQSELFGYDAGAFTGAVKPHKGIFEAAEDGVVFLDEFGEMSPKLQVSMLRILENNELIRVGGTKVKKINCRIIAATNANIEDLILQKKFREDLYHRLKQFTISIVPLRERKVDIPDLVHFFLNQQDKKQSQIFSKELMLKFAEYHWPGNIRELKNEIDRIKILCGNKSIVEIDDVDIEWIIKKPVTPEIHKTLESFTPDYSYEQMHQIILNTKLSSTDKRHKQIILLFKQHKKLNRVQIAQALKVSLLTITRDLKCLVADGLVEKHMPTLSSRSHYFEIKES